MPPAGEITITLVTGSRRGGEMEQLVTAAPPGASFGALLRGHRRRALLSQEQLAARADLGARTVRALEAGRVRSPRLDTVRLLADALQLTGPQRENLLAAAPQIIHHRAGPAARHQRPAMSPPRRRWRRAVSASVANRSAVVGSRRCSWPRSPRRASVPTARPARCPPVLTWPQPRRWPAGPGPPPRPAMTAS